MEIFINAPSYSDTNGGAIVLHRLCHLINEITEHNAYLISTGYPLKGMKKFRRFFKGTMVKPKDYQTKLGWNTPIWNKTRIPKEGIAIYPEIVDGNPFNSKYVVRWLLHQPGFHNGSYKYSSNELFFKFNSAIKDFNHKNGVLSSQELKVIYYPIDTYNLNNEEERTIECCHLVRKGSYKPEIHPKNSISLDNKSHQECADILKKAKRFICYDDYTAYSIFAVLCGCQSIVVPDKNTSIEQWYPNPADRYGIAYGMSNEQLNWAEKTKEKVLEHIIKEHKRSEECVINCIKEIALFWHSRQNSC